MNKTANSNLFEAKEMKVSGNVEDVRAKIAEALNSGLLKFKIEDNRQPFDEGFVIRGKMSLLDGWNRCYIVGGQAADGEVTIRYKVLDYLNPKDKEIAGPLGLTRFDRHLGGDALNQQRT